jgi:trans-2,3-dihydro-3-hydroxyanthranilate isomerase
MRYLFVTADVFTDRIFGGNPLAVFPSARGLTAMQMQRVAREMNLSETVFVFPAHKRHNTRRLRIFTPEMELPFAGHPTVGAAVVLAATGEIELTGDVTRIVFEEGVGPVPVTIFRSADWPLAAQLTSARLPERGPEPPAGAASVIGLTDADLAVNGWAPAAYSCGVPFVFIPVRDRGALARASLDRATWQRLLASFWAPHVYVVTPDAELPGSHVRARMFAPAMGIAEDPATGGAVAALAGFLSEHDALNLGTRRWVVEQGYEMGRPSSLEVEADFREGAVTAVRVGGRAVLVSEGTMEVP